MAMTIVIPMVTDVTVVVGVVIVVAATPLPSSRCAPVFLMTIDVIITTSGTSVKQPETEITGLNRIFGCS